jgi:hypothetical protein
MIELIATYLVLPFVKKLSEKVINEAVDNAVDEADSGLKRLFKSVFNGSVDKKEFLSRLKDDPHAAAQFNRISANLLPQIAKQMSSITSDAAKMDYCASVLEGLGALAVRIERPLVIAGFLNGTNYVTVIAPRDFENNPQVDKRNRTVRTFDTGDAPMDVYLKRCKNSKERDEEIERLRDLVNKKPPKTLPSEVKEFYSLVYIYPGWITLRGLKYADVGLDEPKISTSRPTLEDRVENSKREKLRETYDGSFIEDLTLVPQSLKGLLEINNCDGLRLMLQSSTEFIREKAKDLNKWGKASGAGKN